jgi:glucan phosphoethanolaminetransferase (alkaline phosphatase superfamily)
MGIGQLFMRVWRMNVSKSLGRNVSQEEMNRVLKIILIFFFLILVLCKCYYTIFVVYFRCDYYNLIVFSIWLRFLKDWGVPVC